MQFLYSLLLMMGTAQKFWPGSVKPPLVWVWVWKISPKNPKFFNFFPFGLKKVPRSKTGWPLIYCRSKVCSGLVRSGPISTLYGCLNQTVTSSRTFNFSIFCFPLEFIAKHSFYPASNNKVHLLTHTPIYRKYRTSSMSNYQRFKIWSF